MKEEFAKYEGLHSWDNPDFVEIIIDGKILKLNWESIDNMMADFEDLVVEEIN